MALLFGILVKNVQEKIDHLFLHGFVTTHFAHPQSPTFPRSSAHLVRADHLGARQRGDRLLEGRPHANAT